MSLIDKYQSTADKETNGEDKKKILLSNDAYAITEALDLLLRHLSMGEKLWHSA